jgi:uncharacterized Zn finger protein (UPF0148 family)
MNQHTMQLAKTQLSGEEEWYCPTCGRRFLLQLSPDYKKTVLVVGDSTAKHTGADNNNQALDLLVQAMLKQETTAAVQEPLITVEDQLAATEPASDNLRKLLKNEGLDHLL